MGARDGARLIWRPGPWHLTVPTTAPPKHMLVFLVTGALS
jgi:hypothetical protein